MRAALLLLLLLDELGLIENSARLIPKADRKKIHEYIFREGVLVAKKSVLSLRIGRNRGWNSSWKYFGASTMFGD